MLVRNLTLSGTRSVHTVRVSTIYQFVTVFNHSDHAITVFPENLTNEREKHYRVPPRIYLTLPLFGAGMVESCQREVVFTVVSEGMSIPSTVIGLAFTEENNNINMPFPDMSAPTPTPLSVIFPEPPILDRRLFAGVIDTGFSGVILTAASKMIIHSLILVRVHGTPITVSLSHRRSGVDIRLLETFSMPGGNSQTLGYIVLESGDSLFVHGVSGPTHVSIYGVGS